MQSIHPLSAKKRHGIEVLFAVLMIATVGASPALATSTSAGVSESYVISASISVGNVPSTGTFTSPPACFPSVGACQASDFSYAFTSTIASNSGTGVTISVLATTLVSGSNVIPLSTRGIVFGNASGFVPNPAASGVNLGALSPTVPFVLGSTSTTGSWAIGMEPILRLNPSAYPAGAYVGQFTVQASTN